MSYTNTDWAFYIFGSVIMLTIAGGFFKFVFGLLKTHGKWVDQWWAETVEELQEALKPKQEEKTNAKAKS